jgi:hypothetical protein
MMRCEFCPGRRHRHLLLNGTVQDTATTSNLLTLQALGLLSNPNEGFVGFKTTKPFNAVEVDLGSLASVPGTLDVYWRLARFAGTCLPVRRCGGVRSACLRLGVLRLARSARLATFAAWIAAAASTERRAHTTSSSRSSRTSARNLVVTEADLGAILVGPELRHPPCHIVRAVVVIHLEVQRVAEEEAEEHVMLVKAGTAEHAP